jgi:NAD(P)H-dependent FMN reductase
MTSAPVNILAVAGSLNQNSVTCVVVKLIAERLRQAGASVDMLDLAEEPLPMFNPESSYGHETFPKLKARVDHADVLLLGTPDYHGSVSGTMKNFLDHFWQEFAGKLFASVVASHEKGLTVTDQLRTIARQCYAWSMPYAVSFADKADVKDGRIISDSFERRVEMFVRDIRVYGEVLARQRQADLAGSEPGFLAKHRKH